MYIHPSERAWSLFAHPLFTRRLPVIGPMTVCNAPERTQRLHGPPAGWSTRKLNDRSTIVSAQEKHR